MNRFIKADEVAEELGMTDLYNQVYTSRPPIINGLLYPGTYILAGAPKLGKSFLMAQLAYHVSTGTEMWGFPLQKGSVLYLALEDDYGRLQKRLYKMFGVETTKNLYFGIEAPSLGDGLIDQLKGFVEDHPDFSYRGAKAVLALTGYNGLFGHRTHAAGRALLGEEQYEEDVIIRVNAGDGIYHGSLRRRR